MYCRLLYSYPTTLPSLSLSKTQFPSLFEPQFNQKISNHRPKTSLNQNQWKPQIFCRAETRRGSGNWVPKNIYEIQNITYLLKWQRFYYLRKIFYKHKCFSLSNLLFLSLISASQIHSQCRKYISWEIHELRNINSRSWNGFSGTRRHVCIIKYELEVNQLNYVPIFWRVPTCSPCSSLTGSGCCKEQTQVLF